MMRDSDDTAVEDSIAEISKAEVQRPEPEISEPTTDEHLSDHRPRSQKFVSFLKSGKGIALIAFVVLIATIMIVPMTRYALAGLVISKQTTVTVVDDTTGKPVSEALVHFGRVDAKTDSKGVAKLDSIAVGDHPLSVEKKYYATTTTSYLVPILKQAQTTVTLKATGRVATVTVTNAISGKPLAGATVKIGDTVATSDDSGIASIALATKDTDQTGTVSFKDFRAFDISVNTKDMAPSMATALVPDGNVYFMSNRTGTYNVMSSTLDGKNQAVVVKGTGKEVAYELSLLSSPSRDYLSYVTRRGNEAAPDVYVVTTATGAMDKVNGSSSAAPVGWIDNKLYFSKSNYNNGVMVDKRMQLMAYAADSKQVNEIDSSHLEGDQYTYADFGPGGNYQLVGDRIYYAKCWDYSSFYGGNQDRTASLMAIVNGKPTSLKDVKQNAQAYCDTVAAKPGMIYYRLNFWNDNRSDSYRYQPNKAVESVQVSDGELYNNRYTYLSSPNGEKTFWTETRDGKKVSFIGNADGQNEQQVSSADYTAYGWFGDDYVLYSKGGSELYVAAAGARLDGAHKVTDYYSQAHLID